MPPEESGARASPQQIEEGTAFAPAFDARGLVTAVATDIDSGEVLMVAHMNAEALARTIETGDAWFWSRSRRKLWQKGEESGNRLDVVELRVDCDQDAILVKGRIAGDGVACHQGYRSCFYRSVPVRDAVTPALGLVFDAAMPRHRRK